MQAKTTIVGLVLIASLLGYPSKAIAEPLEIKEDIKVYAFRLVNEKWGSKSWDSFDRLVMKESKWDNTAQNPKSTAYGIGQFLNSTWETVGCEKTSDEYKQVSCMIDYIEVRYKTPQKALEFHLKNNHY